MNNQYKAIALFSGGLDSLLAVKWMQKLGYEIIPVFLSAPYLNSQRAEKTATDNGLSLQVHDFFARHFALVKNPSWGWGKYLNPCVDCHALMFSTAAELLSQYKAHFLISGEVLGQRPMSQKRNAMAKVSSLSQVRDLIVRPLSQKLLPDTMPLTEGWVNRDDMLDINGRSRKAQLTLARELGIVSFPTPAGGCLLTDRNYCLRLQDLMDHQTDNRDDMELLRWGRHFRLGPSVKLIIGRNEAENDALEQSAKGIIINARDHLGPLGVITSASPTSEELTLGLRIFLQYNAKAGQRDVLTLSRTNESDQPAEEISVDKLEREQCLRHLIAYDK